MQPKEGPTTIVRHAYAVYPPMAMLAGMQLDVFTPLKDGPMTASPLANALDVAPDKVRALLYALVHPELLLKFEGDRFANTPEDDAYLVRGTATYLGCTHELQFDLWGTALKAAQSTRADRPHAKDDLGTMSDEDLGAFFRGLHAGGLATGKQLAKRYSFGRFQSLPDVGGGWG